MSRRHNKVRRQDRRVRERRQDLHLHPERVPVAHEHVCAKMLHMLGTWRCRGSREPVFAELDLLFGPVVQLDADDSSPMPQQLAERTIQEIARLTGDQKPS